MEASERSQSVRRNQPVKLLDQVRAALRVWHYSYATEKNYVHWITKFVFFNNMHNPAEMGEKKISAFITHLAVNERVSASTQNQALCALIFLYKHVLKMELHEIQDLTWSKRPKRIPVVFT